MSAIPGLSWEPIDDKGERWGVFNVEGDGGPLATFRDAIDAQEWLLAMQKHADEDRRLDEYHAVMCIRSFDDGDAYGGVPRDYFWNSYDKAPGEA